MEIMTRQAQLTPLKPMTLEGYALIFDTPADIGGEFREVILPTALNETDMSDVALFYNHDLNRVPLARVPNTLKLKTDQHGLKFSAVLPNTTEGAAVYESVKRGDLRGCSFAFSVDDDVFDNGLRKICKIGKILEISLTPFPAYKDTSVEARNKEIGKMKFKNVAESFNFYNQKTAAEIEKRAAEIEKEIDGENADVKSLNIELEGMKQAKENIEESINAASNAKSILQKIISNTDKIISSVADEGASTMNTEEITTTDEYRSAFFKSLQGKQLNNIEQRAMRIAKEDFEKRGNEFNTSTNSAAVIPTSTLDEIISKARKQGGLLAECRGFSVPAKIAIPVATPDENVNNWHVEGQAAESQKVSPTTINFDPNEIIKIFSLSTKVQNMALPAFENYISQELNNCVTATLEDCLINGDGNGKGLGLINNTVFNADNVIGGTDTAVNSQNTTQTVMQDIDLTAILDAIATLPSAYHANAKFAMSSSTLWAYVYPIADSCQRPLLVQDLQNGGITKILGFPVVIDDHIARGDIIFGDFNYMAYNLLPVVIESSTQSSFKSGLIDYRAMAIADTRPILSEAFVLITSNLDTYNKIFA